jgi:7-cyano-7-deazaguanine synthase
MKTIVLLSGGMDSATVLAIAKNKGYQVYALSFDYGQRHRVELDAAKNIAIRFSVKEHKIIKIDLRQFGKSALTDDIAVPKERSKGIPPTYVPARNTIFLSYALAWAEVIDCQHIHIGVNALDYNGYPDCRPEYLEAYQYMANLTTDISIHAPLIHWTKSQIIRQGIALDLDYSLTSSCYDPLPNGKPCNECDACYFRAKGFSGV